MQHIQTGHSSSVEANYITTNNITTNNVNSGIVGLAQTIVGGLFYLIAMLLTGAVIVITAPVSVPVIYFYFMREKNRLDTINAVNQRHLEG